MNLQSATTLLPSLKFFEGTRSIDGHLVKKFLIIPKDSDKQKEFLEVYQFNKWDEHGLIIDCYKSEDLTIVVQYDLPYPIFKHQDAIDFLLKKKII